jgi:hypothetical protein
MKAFNTLIALALISGSAIASNDIEWQPAGERDLVADRLTTQTDAIPASFHTESAPLSYTWADTERSQADAALQGAVVESRQYWLDLDSHALERGIKLPISAPGAVIRVSALESGTDLRLDSDLLELSVNGTALNRTAIESATGAELRQQGMQVPQDSLAFRLPADSAAGTLEMRLPGTTSGKVPMVIHVFEPESPWVARMSAARSSFLSDQPINLDLVLEDGANTFSVDRVNAMLVTPDASQMLNLSRQNNGQILEGIVPTSVISAAPGLHEIHAYVEHDIDGITVKRDLKLAIGVAPASGRFTGQVQSVPALGLNLSVGIEVAVEGRYQVNAEIFGTNARGDMEPMAFTQSAAVLDAGQGRIGISIDADTLLDSGLSAPFEVRNLQLLDQGRMFVLEHREQALKVDLPRQDIGLDFEIQR